MHKTSEVAKLWNPFFTFLVKVFPDALNIDLKCNFPNILKYWFADWLITGARAK
jgi:hypothetical protein